MRGHVRALGAPCQSESAPSKRRDVAALHNRAKFKIGGGFFRQVSSKFTAGMGCWFSHPDITTFRRVFHARFPRKKALKPCQSSLTPFPIEWAAGTKKQPMPRFQERCRSCQQERFRSSRILCAASSRCISYGSRAVSSSIARSNAAHLQGIRVFRVPATLPAGAREGIAETGESLETVKKCRMPPFQP